MRLVYIEGDMYTRQIGGSHQVVTTEGKATLNVHLIGPHPIIRHFLDRMTFSRIVRSCLATPREGIMDYAQSLSVLIQNILLSPGPLYRLSDWAQPIDSDALGLSEAEKAAINDDRMARCLDALVAPRARSLFFRIALHIIKHFELDTRRIHHDTTTVTFQGQYKTSKSRPQITYGVNKDHRPDLKQLVFGVNVTSDGAVPISHEVYSGNRTDDTVHRNNVERLREILGRDDFIYVADSKLCTRKNLEHISGYGGKFVTVLPRTRVEDKNFRKSLREGASVRWRKLLKLENNQRNHDSPNIYYTTSDGPQKTREGYRLIWYRSTQKAKLDEQTREAALQKAEADLFDLNTRLNRHKLRKRSQINKAVKEILKQSNCQNLIDVKILSRKVVHTKRLRPGRPREGDPLKQVHENHYQLEVRRNKQALAAEARTDGVFPLLSNLETTQATKKDILLFYKYQPYVEKRHALLKSELMAAPVYIKTPRRAAGLIHAKFLAMVVDALIERTVREGMKRENIEELLILPEGRPTKTPTTARVLEMFSDVSWYEFQRGDETITFPIELTKLQKQLLRLLEMDISAYG